MLLPGIGAAATLGVAASRLRPPAPDVAVRCLTVVSVLLLAKLVAWVGTAGDTFGREQRLLTFVLFLSIAFSWVALRQDIGEAAFDYQVNSQKRNLAVAARTLSWQLTGFLEDRRRAAPPPPNPATWEGDTALIGRFEAETVRRYEHRFGPSVRTAHALLSLRGMRDRDFDTFFKSPANEFQMRVIAAKMAFLAEKLDRETPR